MDNNTVTISVELFAEMAEAHVAIKTLKLHRTKAPTYLREERLLVLDAILDAFEEEKTC